MRLRNLPRPTSAKESDSRTIKNSNQHLSQKIHELIEWPTTTTKVTLVYSLLLWEAPAVVPLARMIFTKCSLFMTMKYTKITSAQGKSTHS